MNIYENVYWNVERSLGAKVGIVINVRVDRNFGAEVGGGDGEVSELEVVDKVRSGNGNSFDEVVKGAKGGVGVGSGGSLGLGAYSDVSGRVDSFDGIKFGIDDWSTLGYSGDLVCGWNDVKLVVNFWTNKLNKIMEFYFNYLILEETLMLGL